MASNRSKLMTGFAVFAVACALFYAMGQWLIPFVIAFILAYALHMPTQLISNKLHVSRTVSAIIILMLILSVIYLFSAFFIPLIKDAAIILIQKCPVLLQTVPQSINELLNNTANTLGLDKTFDIGGGFRKYLMEMAVELPSYIMSFINTGVALVYVVMFVVMTPIITFYLLKDWEKLSKSVESLIKRTFPPAVIEVMRLIDTKLAFYMKGQLLVCSVLAVLYTTGLFLIGVDEYIVCGVLSGVLSFVPFFGPFIGLLITLAVSIDSFAFSFQYVLIACLYVAMPFVDSNFITPRLIGKRTGVQPAWLLFSICATVSVLGTLGIFISVPTAVILSTVCKEMIKKL